MIENRDIVYSVRIAWPATQYEPAGEGRIGPYFTMRSAKTEARKAERKGSTVLGIDSGTVQWGEVS